MTARSGRSAERGFSLLEVLFVVGILASLVGMIVNLTLSSADAQKYAERLARATEVNQEVLNEIRSELLSLVDLLEDGTLGDGYAGALVLDPDAPDLASSERPLIVVDGPFEKESSSGARTGNALLFARQSWTTRFTCSSGRTYVVDVHRMVYYYLTKREGGPELGSPLGLNLCKFVSEPLVDGGQIDAITDATDRSEVLLHLVKATADDDGHVHPAAKLVWLRGRAISDTDALREIDPATGLLSSSPLPPRPDGSWQILRDVERSHAGLLYYRHFSVATNYASARFGVARFGVKSFTGDGFPHGFEVQVGGPSAARQVLVHLSIATTNNRGTTASSDLRTTVFVRDT